MLASTSALALLVSRVTREVAGRRELAELHADHLFIDRDGHELAAVIDVEREPNELRQDGRATRPGLDRRACAGILCGLGLLEQAQFDERAFPDGAGHYFFLAWRDRMIILSVDLFLRVRWPFVGLPHGVTG